MRARVRRAAAGAARRARRPPRRASARYHERQKLASWSLSRSRRQRARPARDAARSRRPLRAGRQGRVSVVGADERDSGAGRGRAPRSSWSCPTPDGVRNPLVLAAAHLAGVTRAFTIGGAQAIAALAYGTATIPAVDKICGPGNAYVAAAKRRVFGVVGIDMVAGVSEILVIADATRQSRLGRDGPLLAGRARRDGAGDPASRPTRRCSSASPRARSARSPRCRARAIIAASFARPRRADPDARPRRSVRDRQPHRARASRARGRRSRRAAAEDPPRRRDLHRPLCVARRSATTAPGRTTCCRRGAPRASRRRSASTISRSARACCGSRARARATLGPIAATLAYGEGLTAHARAAEARLDDD